MNALNDANRNPWGGRRAAWLAVLWSSMPAVALAQAEAPAAPELVPATGINFLDLLLKGSYFMIPILLMSLLVVTFAIERLIGLRRGKVLPWRLFDELRRASSPESEFDPGRVYQQCRRYPSSLATVVRSMLVKIGRPHSEVERAVADACEREATRLYANVRWLNLAASVTPLLGLLGTVWGMIRAFHDTTQLAPGQNKADYLAEGIYVALVTTLGGLLVAIPAAIFAHSFEGRIQSAFLRIEELLFNLMPQVEQYEGRVRFSEINGESSELAAADEPSTPTSAVEVS